MKGSSFWVFFMLAVSLLAPACFALEPGACGVYFTKIGCPVCAKADPVILGQWLPTRPDAVIIEYVFTGWYEPNAVLMGEYNLAYGTGGAVPLMIKDSSAAWSGIPAFYSEQDIFNHAESFFQGDGGKCLLKEGEASFESINLNELPESPKLWSGSRLLEKTGQGLVESDFLKRLLLEEDLKSVLASSQYGLKEVEAEPAPYSGGEIEFKQAIEIENAWVLKIRESIELPENVEPLDGNAGNGNGSQNGEEPNKPDAGQGILLSVGIVVACLIGIAIFTKVKKK